MGDGVEDSLCLLSLFFPSHVASNLEILVTFGLDLYPCCHGLCGAVEDVGYHSPCSTCCTSPHTLSPTGDTFLSPSGHDFLGLNPSVHKAPDPEEVAFDCQGCGYGSHQGIETVILTDRSLLLLLLPSRLRGMMEEIAVSQSACNRRILIESETLTLSARNCVRCDERKESGGKICRGNENGTGTDSGNKSTIWILIETLILIWNGSKESG